MDIINIISLGVISIQAMVAVVFVILNKIEKRQDSNKLSEPDNPLLLTIKAMEVELAELHENNIHMKRIAQLEKDIKEAHKHAEALSKVVGNYGNTMEEVGESIVGGIGGRNVVHTITPVNSNGIVVGGILSKGLVVEKTEEVEESMQHSVPNSKKLDDETTRQNTTIYRTYTRQAGWSTYYDVKLKQSNSKRKGWD